MTDAPRPRIAVFSGASSTIANTEPLVTSNKARASYGLAPRLFEEIDRLGIGDDGLGNTLSGRADFDFFRAAPPGGYTRGLAAERRTDQGDGDIPPEHLGEDFWPYRPGHLSMSPPPRRLAELTNCVWRVLASDTYAGAIWLEGSP